MSLDEIGQADRHARWQLASTARTSPRITVGIACRPLAAVHEPLIDALTLTLADAEMLPHRQVVNVADVGGVREMIRTTVNRSPRAAVILDGVLRITEWLPTEDALVAESLAYATLQSGPEFAAWLRRCRRPSAPEGSGMRVITERTDNQLVITLARPERANAFDIGMRDSLVEALELALVDDSITRVILRAQGRHFCAGGDLAEFGSTPDPATAHLIRTERSVGRLLHRLSARTEVRVNGACIGAGVELAAFAAHVRARPDAFFALPEVAMGLIPGAGGTVSLTRRIGRWRVAYLALTGARLDAETALAWGLVDALD